MPGISAATLFMICFLASRPYLPICLLRIDLFVSNDAPDIRDEAFSAVRDSCYE